MQRPAGTISLMPDEHRSPGPPGLFPDGGERLARVIRSSEGRDPARWADSLTDDGLTDICMAAAYSTGTGMSRPLTGTLAPAAVQAAFREASRRGLISVNAHWTRITRDVLAAIPADGSARSEEEIGRATDGIPFEIVRLILQQFSRAGWTQVTARNHSPAGRVHRLTPGPAVQAEPEFGG